MKKTVQVELRCRRGEHSVSLHFNVSAFCGIRWVAHVFRGQNGLRLSRQVDECKPLQYG